MIWSPEQAKAHKESAEKFREAYVKGENKITRVEDIKSNRNRCFTLIERIDRHPATFNEFKNIYSKLEEIPGFYFQEISHFTIDCHRYKKDVEFPEGLKNIAPNLELGFLISEGEWHSYDRVLKEEINKEPAYDVEIKGIAFGGDGLIAQVWYDDKRMMDFTSRLGERVRKEVPSMDFQWGMVKGKIPYRVVNLTRFTGEEDKKRVLDFVDANKESDSVKFTMTDVNLVFGDHYLQARKTLDFGTYEFAKD